MRINKDNLHLEVSILKELGWEIKKGMQTVQFINPDPTLASFAHFGSDVESALYNSISGKYHIPHIGTIDKALSLPLEEDHHWDIVYYSESDHTVSLLHVLPPYGENEPQYVNSWFYNDEAGRYATLSEKICAIWLKYRKDLKNGK